MFLFTDRNLGENDYRYYESKLYESNKRIEEEIKYFLIELKMKINLFF